MKRIFIVLLACILICAPVCASGESTETAALEIKDLPAISAILIDIDTGSVLFEKGADARLPLASVTKIMTMLLVAEAVDAGQISFSDLVTASEHACSMGGSQIYLKVGEQMTVEELFKAVAIASANDASVALAEFVGGSEPVFASMMNERARALGMRNTNFKNACGLDEDGHYSSARDIALMSRAFYALPAAHKYATVWMDSVRDGAFGLVNTNKLVKLYNGITGLKTGSTGKAKFCLSATAERGGTRLCAVVMGCDTGDLRFQSAAALLDYGFASFEHISLVGDTVLPEIAVLRGESESLTPQFSSDISALIPRGSSGKVERSLSLCENVTAPVAPGQVLGRLSVVLEGKTIGEIEIIAPQEIPKLGFFKAFSRLIRSFGMF